MRPTGYSNITKKKLFRSNSAGRLNAPFYAKNPGRNTATASVQKRKGRESNIGLDSFNRPDDIRKPEIR